MASLMKTVREAQIQKMVPQVGSVIVSERAQDTEDDPATKIAIETAKRGRCFHLLHSRLKIR